MQVTKRQIVTYYQAQPDDHQRMYSNPRNAYRKKRRIDATADFIRPWMHTGQAVLEIGCGDGYFTSRVASDWGWSSYYGCDFSIHKLKRLRGHLRSATAVSADAESLPFADSLFDIAVCFETIEHLLDPEAALSEMWRVLKPTGVLVLSTPVIARIQALVKRCCACTSSGHGPQVFEEHVQEFTIKDVLTLTRRVGFAVRTWRTCVYEFSFFTSLFRHFPYGWYQTADRILGYVPFGAVGIGRLRVSMGAEYMLLAATKAVETEIPSDGMVLRKSC